MYPHFIEVHDIRKPEDAMLINIKAIKHIYFEPETNSGAISLVDKVFVPTKESYDELKKLIEDIGCQIHKPDPRLVSKPLTGFDFLGMKKGEPIWSPNRQEWYLFSSYDPVHMEGKVTDVNGNTGIFNRDTLIKFPLYRMKGIRLADYEFDHPEIDERLIQTTKKEEK